MTERLHRLENAQVIVGYTFERRSKAKTEHIRASMGVQADGNHRWGNCEPGLIGEPALIAFHDSDERRDSQAELRARRRNCHACSNV